MNHSKTLQLSEPEALVNLHVILKHGSEASSFYNKHVAPAATSLKQAFEMMYNRFSSAERRDRLLEDWKSLNFNRFLMKPNATKQSALRDLCETASLLQLQLSPSYQDDQHLRDALLNAVKSESWA